MGIYLEFLYKSFRSQFAYRVNSLFLTFSTLLQLFVSYNVWRALFRNRAEVKGMAFDDMIVFIVINMLVNALLDTGIGSAIEQRFIRGDIVLDLLKPVSFKYFLFFDELGRAAYKMLLPALPVFVIAILFFNFTLPPDPLRIFLFIITMTFGTIINYTIDYVLGLLVFWLKTDGNTRLAYKMLFQLFSGVMIPLQFYPEWLFGIARILPFRFITFEPIMIFLGKVSYMDALRIISFQLIWIAALLIIEKILWRGAQRVVTIDGG
jgi:ABC-2 type transport system permease protein